MQAPTEQRPDTSGFLQGDVLADKYLLLERLGAGGMGQVWTAQNLATGAEIALKLLLAPGVNRSSEVVARFRREAHATAQLAHRGIVRVFDLVELSDADGSVAMVMERLRGKTLAAHLRHNGPLSVAETLSIVLPLLGALHHVHGIGLVHRDLKPENVFLAIEPDGEIVPKLLDFGVSKSLRADPRPITLDGIILGTPSYMSPEQLCGGKVDARSDLFAAGVVLYLCLTGEKPFAASQMTRGSMLAALEAMPAKPANVPAALWQTIARAMAKDPDDRFSSAAELADALTSSLRPSWVAPVAPLPARPPSPLLTLLGVSTRRKLAGIAVVACATGVFSGALGSRYATGDFAREGREGREGDTPPRRSASAPRRLLATADWLNVCDGGAADSDRLEVCFSAP